MAPIDFLTQIAERPMTTLNRAIALLWLVGRDDPAKGMASSSICAEFERAGHPKQNVSRLDTQLKEHPGVSRGGSNEWRLHPKTRRQLDSEYAFAMKPRVPFPSDSVLPRDLFASTRGYIERVVEQINRSYDVELWDCTAVMCRRLLETLIIETYEKAGRAADVKDKDGQFAMFSGLIAVVETDRTINLGRNARRGLKDMKQLGDLAAHNRRFNARKDDIDRVRDGLRIAAEEFLYLAGLRPEATVN
jgi:hypothetical protein